MSGLQRRCLLARMLALGSVGTVASTVLLMGRGARAQGAPAPRVIEVIAQRFKYTPSDIPLKVGEHVVLVVTSLDFVHGMNLPDFGMRFDLLPGQVTRIELQPQQAGIFDIVCDNFCGSGHEDMQGRIVVSA